jgi:predicted AAA+ superfamily ATPase
MEYIHRTLEKKLDDYLKVFPVTTITGPRQSGKSTLIRNYIRGRYKYVTFDDPLLAGIEYESAFQRDWRQC